MDETTRALDTHRSSQMSRKSTLLAFAAAASLGAVALSTSDALAFHASGSGVRAAPGAMHTGSMHMGGGLRYGGGYHASALKIVKLPPPIVHPPHHWHYWRWHWAWRHHYWVPPVVAGGVVGGVAASYAATTPNRCNCLTKEYTPEGAVVFKDLCTHEAAMNPPGAPGDTSQSPQQQGYLQPQAQAQ
jgi:hypothetical protein